MTKCLYPYCSNPETGENYFRVPVEPELRRKWMSAIPQVLNLTKEALEGKVFLCSKHFDKLSFNYDENGKIKGMKKHAIPSVFYVPSSIDDNQTEEEEEEEEGEAAEEPTDTDAPVPPPISITTSDSSLYFKTRDAELKLLIFKDKYKKEEEEFIKARDELQKIQKSTKTEEIQEVYLNVMKKLRPLAPKQPVKKKPKTLEEVIVYMRKERLVSDEASLVLLNLFGDVPVQDWTTPVTKEGFDCFAQYLTFYNTEVYENIGSQFDIQFPPIADVRKLFNPTPGEPGWNQKAFDCVKQKSKKLKNGDKLLCSLLVGTTNIKRREEWDGKKVRGYVDCGSSSEVYDMDSDGLAMARSALVLMAVPLDPLELWRAPVAYFFINSLTSSEKANVIRECILRLHSVGSVILSVTCDVISCDKIFLDSLGVSFDLLPQISPYFVHPADPLLRVHLILDNTSLLTSVQNMWATSQRFLDGENRSINWKFVSELLKLVEAQAASFTQTYDPPHWSWDSVYVRNHFLAQVFSESTADAVEFSCDALRLPQFEDCEGTVQFIRVMSKIKRLLTNRRYVKGTNQDDASLRSDFQVVLEYLSNIRDEKAEPLHTGTSGSIRLLYQTLLSCQELSREVPGFSTHCISLDELELVFYVIKSYTGWGLIPTARQFTAAFTNHVEKHGYLTAWGRVQANGYWWIDSVDVSMARMEGRAISKPELKGYCVPSNCASQVSFERPTAEFKSFSAGNFVAVSIVKTLANILFCETCLESLQEPPSSDNPLLLVLRKTCGAVICPSQDVLKICACSEHHLKIALQTLDFDVKSSLFEWKNERFITSIGTTVVRDMLEKGVDLFPTLKHHFYECSPNASHLYRLIRGVSCCYVEARLRSMKSWCPT